MSKLYTPIDGYTSKSGVWNHGTDFVMMTADERKEMYSCLTNAICIVREAGMVISGWTKLDERAIRTAAKSLGPIYSGGSNRDLTLPDLKKVWKALEKLEVPLKEQMNNPVEWPECIIPENYVANEEGPYHDCSKREVWKHMDTQRATTRAQTLLDERGYTANLMPFKEVWD